jgi:hypothetical protein
MSVAAASSISPNRGLSPGIREVGARWGWALRMTAVASLLGADVIHASAVSTHRYWVAAGVFFAVVAAVEGLLAVVMLVAPTRGLYVLALAVSAATVAVWLVSRTAGLPVGPTPGVPLAIDTADAVSTFFEVLTIAALMPVVVTSDALGRAAADRRNRAAAAVAFVVIALLTALGARSPEPGEAQGGHALGTPAASHAPGASVDG